MSFLGAKANAVLVRREKDIAKKLDLLSCAIEELAMAAMLKRGLLPEERTLLDKLVGRFMRRW